MNTRLDYISSFKEGAVEEMVEIRKDCLEMEEKITSLYSSSLELTGMDVNQHRVYVQALTHLESFLMYAIKLLCLKNEVKSELATDTDTQSKA